MKSAADRLSDIVGERDEEIAELKRKVENLEGELEAPAGGWTRHRKGDSDTALPVPRMELEWSPMHDDGDWAEYVVEYRLVFKHLAEEGNIFVPMGRTTIRGSLGTAPWDAGRNGVPSLPFRDGAHAHHDAAHFGLPLYVITPAGHVRIDGDENYASQRARGLAARRAPT